MRIIPGMAALLLATAGQAQAPASDADALARRAEDFMRVRNAWDQAAMAAMMAPEFQEISPIGDVDTRDQVIGFYAPDKKTRVPPMTFTETVARPSGDIGTVTMRIAYTMPGKDGQTQTRAVRAGFVARRAGRDWRFVSLQFTPIRG